MSKTGPDADPQVENFPVAAFPGCLRGKLLENRSAWSYGGMCDARILLLQEQECWTNLIRKYQCVELECLYAYLKC
jgi:hypothetical protein